MPPTPASSLSCMPSSLHAGIPTEGQLRPAPRAGDLVTCLRRYGSQTRAPPRAQCSTSALVYPKTSRSGALAPTNARPLKASQGTALGLCGASTLSRGGLQSSPASQPHVHAELALLRAFLPAASSSCPHPGPPGQSLQPAAPGAFPARPDREPWREAVPRPHWSPVPGPGVL